MDYAGLSILIGAIAGLITVVGGFAMQIATFIRQGQMLRAQHAQAAAGAARDQKLAEVHDLVNGQSGAIRKLEYEAGQRAGTDAERANPTPPV